MSGALGSGSEAELLAPPPLNQSSARLRPSRSRRPPGRRRFPSSIDGRKPGRTAHHNPLPTRKLNPALRHTWIAVFSLSGPDLGGYLHDSLLGCGIFRLKAELLGPFAVLKKLETGSCDALHRSPPQDEAQGRVFGATTRPTVGHQGHSLPCGPALSLVRMRMIPSSVRPVGRCSPKTGFAGEPFSGKLHFSLVPARRLCLRIAHRSCPSRRIAIEGQVPSRRLLGHPRPTPRTPPCLPQMLPQPNRIPKSRKKQTRTARPQTRPRLGGVC